MNPPPHQAYSSPECERQAIDAEIKSLEESIRALRRRRNALAPISSLPTEVIAIIFSHCRLPTSTISALTTEDIDILHESYFLPSLAQPGRSPDHCLAWLCTAHVCHQWREIALGHPLFWSHVDFTNLNLASAPEILARAKKAPLHLKVIQTRVSQICHLSISAESFRLQKIVEGLTSPAPTLEYLSLSHPYSRNILPLPISVPDTLFSGTTPRLSSLELRHCDISSNSPLLKGLRFLEVRTMSKSARPNFADWLDALREMPDLEKLILHSSSTIVLPFPSTFDINRVVSLPSLTHLDISANAKNCALVLSYLFLPALTRLCVHLGSHLANGDVQRGLLSLLQHADGPQDIKPLQSVLIYGERTRANILAWPIPDIDVDLHDPFALLSAALSARVALSIQGIVHHRDPHSQLDRAMMTLPLENIVTLTAQHQSYLDEQFWLCHAPKWHLLQCVIFTLSEAHGFIKMLLQDISGHESLLLPSLTTLVLIDVALNSRRTQRLCDALMKRVEQGVPLGMLDLRTCRATTCTLRLLSEIVVDVWGPAEVFEGGEVVIWGSVIRGPFVREDSGRLEFS